jgi:UDP-N-acetylglucosamine 2-epimerase (non-hydrolysing)
MASRTGSPAARPLDLRPAVDEESDGSAFNWPLPGSKVLVVVGTRPEVIKMAPVVQALRRDARFSVHLCVVAQQGELLDQALAEWRMTPDSRVEIPIADRRLARMLAAMLPGLADVIDQVQPDLLMVEGDTTTNLGAALAAFYAGVPVAHVEAGLRSGDPTTPFPEEMHRLLVDRIASIHYAPTLGARQNLMAERLLDGGGPVVVGNTVVDALLSAAADPTVEEPPLPRDRRVLLVTAHRRENFGNGIESICRAIRQLTGERDDIEVVFVLHSNPAAFAPVRAALGRLPNVHLIEPQPYRAFVKLLARADIVLTDSGGVQEEAPYLGTPVLVTRDLTERPEASAAGSAWIIGTDSAAIVSAVNTLLDDAELYQRMARHSAPYGDGRASMRIHEDLGRRLAGRDPARSGTGEERPARQLVPVMDPVKLAS